MRLRALKFTERHVVLTAGLAALLLIGPGLMLLRGVSELEVRGVDVVVAHLDLVLARDLAP